MKGRVTVLFGLVLMLSGLLWYAVVLRESTYAANKAQEVVPQLQQTIIEQQVLETEPEKHPEQTEVMTERIVDGIGYVGVLRIPVLDLELPVISSWSTENGKIAPCRYSGSIYQDDLILCAHNYESHFGKLKQLTIGDAVEFTDMDGNCFFYQVLETEILNGTDVEKIRDGDWDLTLFTCTPGGKMRYSVRCGKLS